MTEAIFQNEIYSLKDKLFRLAKRMLFDRQAAEDATQDVLVKLWQKRSELGKYKNKEVLAMVAIRNKCLDEIKKDKRRRIHYRASGISAISFSSPDKGIEAKDKMTLVKRAIEELPEQQRTIIQLRDVEGMDYDEIEAILEISQGTIRTNLSRARKKVRTALLKSKEYGLAKH